MVCRHSMWMAVRIVVGLLLAAGAAGGYFWLHADDMITSAVRDKLAEMAPGWQVDLANVQVRGQQAVVHGITVQPGPDRETLIDIPELVVTFDRDALAEWQTVQIEHLRLVRPTITLIRQTDGSLNIGRLPPLPAPQSNASPAIAIERATVLLEDPTGSPGKPAARLQDIDLTCQPSASKQYRIAGQGRWENYGQIGLRAAANLPAAAVTLQLEGKGLQIDDRLVRTLVAWYPPLHAKLAGLKAPTIPGTPPMQVASIGSGPYGATPYAANQPQPFEQPPRDPTALGLTALADLSLELAKVGGAPTDWSGQCELRQGVLRSPLFPLPLHNLTASINVSPTKLQIGSFRAANGSALLSISGTIEPDLAGYRQQIDLAAEDLSVSGPLRNYLTPGLAKIHGILQPTGAVSVSARLDNTQPGMPSLTLRHLSVRDGTALPTVFPYPVTDIRGDIRQSGDGSGNLMVSMAGRAGGREVRCEGLITQPGPGAGFAMRLTGADIPIDRAMRQAFETEKLAPVGATIDALQLRGRGDATIVLSKAVRTGSVPPPVKVGVDTRVRDATINYEKFPYPLRRVTGRIRCETTSPIWYFENLEGEGRGGAKVTAAGTFDRRKKPGLLAMSFDVLDAPIDADLRRATTTASPPLIAAWKELRPRDGTMSATGVRVRWMPGNPVAIDLPDLRARGATVELASFPYRWSDVDLDASLLSDRRVALRGVTARHDETTLRILGRNDDGSPNDSLAYVDARPDGFDVHLQDVQIDRVIADNELLRAMPGPLRNTVATLRPEGQLGLQFALHLTGEPNQAVRFDYAGDVILTGNKVSAGVELTNARGRIRINRLSNDGTIVEMKDGRLELEGAELLGLKLTDIQGPIRMRGDQLVIGSAEAVRRPQRGQAPPRVAPGERITAKFYGGRAGFDAVAQLGGEENDVQYAARVTVNEARLEQWARENAPRQRLAGEVRAEVRLSGLGDDVRTIVADDGYVQISNAQLGTLPPIAKIFSALSLRPVDDTAFRYAYGAFNIRSGRANFGRVELVGDALKLGGQGYISILEEADYGIRFDLLSQVPNRTPIIGKLIEGMSTGWVHVLLQGSLTNPVVTTSTRPPVLGALGMFRERAESGPLTPPRP